MAGDIIIMYVNLDKGSGRPASRGIYRIYTDSHIYIYTDTYTYQKGHGGEACIKLLIRFRARFVFIVANFLSE